MVKATRDGIAMELLNKRKDETPRFNLKGSPFGAFKVVYTQHARNHMKKKHISRAEENLNTSLNAEMKHIPLKRFLTSGSLEIFLKAC